MNNHVSISYPDYKDLLQGCVGYIKEEKRDAMYKLALRLVSEANWRPEELAEGLGVLLLTWNAAFYTKYGSFDFDALEFFLDEELQDLKSYSRRSILSYTRTDDENIERLFSRLMKAIEPTKRKGRTPVGTAKALHLLGPEFFSIWETAIAKSYGVYWSQRSERSPQLYTKFQHITLKIADNVLKSYEKEYNVSRDIALEHLVEKWYPRVAIAVYSTKPPIRKSMAKMIDEYNYAKCRLNLDLSKHRDTVFNVLASR